MKLERNASSSSVNEDQALLEAALHGEYQPNRKVAA